MLRLVYNNWGRIRGSDRNIDALFRWAPSPHVHPHHYGGQRLDALFGLNYEKGPFSLGVEGRAPIFQNLNGLKIKTQWILNAGFQAMF